MRVVAALLAKSLDLDIRADLPTAKHIMDAYFTSPLSHPPSIDFLQERQRRLGIMLSVVENVFGSHKENDDWSEIYERLDDITPEQFKQRFHPTFDIEAGHLKLYKRAKHAVNLGILSFIRCYIDKWRMTVLRGPSRLSISQSA